MTRIASAALLVVLVSSLAGCGEDGTELPDLEVKTT
jgi:predicted small lipoprotein YifL